MCRWRVLTAKDCPAPLSPAYANTSIGREPFLAPQDDGICLEAVKPRVPGRRYSGSHRQFVLHPPVPLPCQFLIPHIRRSAESADTLCLDGGFWLRKTALHLSALCTPIHSWIRSHSSHPAGLLLCTRELFAWNVSASLHLWRPGPVCPISASTAAMPTPHPSYQTVSGISGHIMCRW